MMTRPNLDASSSHDFEFQNALQCFNLTAPNIDNDGADTFFDTIKEESEDSKFIITGSTLALQEECITTTTIAEVIKGCSNTSPQNSAVNDDTTTASEPNFPRPSSAPQVMNDSLVQEIMHHVENSVSSKRVKRMYGPSIARNDGQLQFNIEAVEVNHQGVRIQDTGTRKKYTEVKPFSFEERHKKLLKDKEKKIKKIFEEERKMREFKAKPIRKFKQPPMNYNTTSFTDPKEPKLRTEERIQKRNKNKHIEEQEVHFKARPATVLQKPPFEPKLGEFPLTDVTGFHLNTEERAKKREEFDILIKKKEAELDVLRLERKKEEEEKLAEEIRILRKEVVHKPIPLPIYKPLKRIISSAPLTEPKSPNFASRKRSNTAHHC